ncbi:MAG: succinate dehydrogenase [Cytophagales bacterium]|nr:MAG: succinate dehydrogenase [Cytophagales bacterium]TAF60769.1 MAG: succinate dehydrogenase [Cytophagales bacterium]
MSWITKTLSSTIGRKVLMALTGLFLCSFLVVHLSGNFQMLMSDGGLQFNAYAKFMTSFPLVKFISYGLYACILLHAIDGFMLMAANRKARPVGYKMVDGAANSSWASRNMGLLGSLILIFIVVHMKNFWYEMHWGDIGIDAQGNRDLYTVTKVAFEKWWYVVFYVFSMVVLAFHLMHGFQSAFQTMGINHKKYTPFIKVIGNLFSIVICIAYAAIPLIMFFNSLS